MKNESEKRAEFTDREMYPTLWITVFALFFAAAGWFFAGQPTISHCWIYSSWDIYCPGCGCTRSLIALFKGEVLRAVYFNPAVPYTVGLIFIYLSSQSIWRLRGKSGWVFHYQDWWFPVLVILLVGNCILRNFMWWCLEIPL